MTLPNRGFWVALALMLIAFWLSACASRPLREVSVDYRHFLPGSRALEMGGNAPVQGVNLNLSLALGGPFYWKNRVHFLTSSSQVSWIGWNPEIGASFGQFDTFFNHHSQHSPDHPQPWPMRFPNEDSIGFRWWIYPTRR